MSEQSKKPHIWWLASIVASLVGLGFSIHLTYLHAMVYLSPGYKSGCNINHTFNCEAVAFSKYAIFLNLPVAVWGLLGYIAFVGVGIYALVKRQESSPAATGLFAIMACFSAVTSLVLFVISKTQIKALCPSCIATYFANVVLLVLAFVILNQENISIVKASQELFNEIGKKPQFLVISIVAGLVLVLTFPQYWETTNKKDIGLFQGIKYGHAWIGAKDPLVVVTEYADYQCPHCKIQHAFLRKVLRDNKDIMRIVHKHYPLDHHCHPLLKKKKKRFHPKACLFARASFCAGKQKKFWKMNDLLFAKSRELNRAGLLQSAKELKMDAKAFEACLDSNEAKNAIDRDLQAGEKLGVRGTPYFIVNGQHFKKGYIPPKELATILARVKQAKAAKKNPPKKR